MPEKISVNKPPSAKQQRKPSAKSLYRKPRDVEPESNLTWANLVVEPSTASNKINKTTELVSILNSFTNDNVILLTKKVKPHPTKYWGQ